MTVNASLTTECVKASSYWGSTIYTNICDGTSHLVQWGTLDYWGNVAIFVGILVPVSFLFWSMLTA